MMPWCVLPHSVRTCLPVTGTARFFTCLRSCHVSPSFVLSCRLGKCVTDDLALVRSRSTAMIRPRRVCALARAADPCFLRGSAEEADLLCRHFPPPPVRDNSFSCGLGHVSSLSSPL